MYVRELIIAVTIGLAPPHVAYADDAHHKNADAKLAAVVAPAAGLAEGEVRKVDKDAGKVTIKHGPLPNLDMPAMTMVFRVKDPAMLDQLKAGDKIDFEAAKVGGAYTVMKFETIKR
jgi:Cu/Ag efflux protein CusF